MNLIKKVGLCAAFCSLILMIAKCDSTEPPIEAHGLVLKLEDVSCTEIWITLTTANLQLPAAITLKQTNSNGDTKSQILNLKLKTHYST